MFSEAACGNGYSEVGGAPTRVYPGMSHVCVWRAVRIRRELSEPLGARALTAFGKSSAQSTRAPRR